MRTLLLPLLLALALPAAATCLPAGAWQDGEGRPLSAAEALRAAAAARVVLLGEEHANAAHHRWQAATIAALAADGRPLAIGLEQLPGVAQPALDRWVAGDIDEAGFLQESGWAERWGHDFAAYRPLFALARERRIPMFAMNVEREFIRAVARQGFAGAAAVGTAPIGQPAPAPASYIARLEKAFAAHGRSPSPEALARFVDAQTVWDRAMAEAIVARLSVSPSARIVAIMGHGHIENGDGVEHQLAALGERSVWSAIPVKAGPDCVMPPPRAADALAGTG